jgi:hypothetical protein
MTTILSITTATTSKLVILATANTSLFEFEVLTALAMKSYIFGI